MSGTIHAGCIALGGRGVLIVGGSGSGKSDLALRMIDRGAGLVSDDYTLLRAEGGRLYASAPVAIAGRIEVRGIGLIEMAAVGEAPLCLLIDLDSPPERLPEPRSASFLGLELPAVTLAALEASAAIKLELALDHFGLPAP
ncbi:MAG TPA: HPr kinase/phosphatase C-terminal domain-containing protein [Allosphingosinicella sp.]|nr:HPr kinase/phosphatase C-terminal domain-containing protein [Allosphingosinicella sp.]